MNLNFDPLTTDLLVYLLVFAAIVFASYSACFEHLRAPWRQVAHNKIAMASALVLSGYLLIALCDSIHFQQPLLEANGKPSRDQGGNIVYQSEAISLFDLFVKNIREKDEKTYSAPLATHYYTKENITLPDGKQVRNFPRLQYGGKHLGNQNQRFRDLVDKALRGGGLFVLWGFAIIGIFFLAKKFSTSGSSPDSPSKDGIFSGGSLVIYIQILSPFWNGQSRSGCFLQGVKGNSNGHCDWHANHFNYAPLCNHDGYHGWLFQGMGG
jgi:peptide/nickel transport system permease protein